MELKSEKEMFEIQRREGEMKVSWGSDHVEVGYQRNPEEEGN